MTNLPELSRKSPTPEFQLEPLPTYRRDLNSFQGLIIHLGVSAFHRSHEAMFTHELLLDQQTDDSLDERWGIVGLGLRGTSTKKALEQQDFLYSVVSRGDHPARVAVVGSIVDIFVSSEEVFFGAVMDPRTRILSLTVTEAGYFIDHRSGELDTTVAQVAQDIANYHAQDEPPLTPVGFITKSLKMRQMHGLAPLTVLSCDNLPGNGDLTKVMVLHFLKLVEDFELLAWVEEKCSFPNSMVDRITPATKPWNPERPDAFSDSIRKTLCASVGFKDQWPIITEPFRQWVIEDDFVSGRPAWERKGALFVTDVAPYETMKLRLLNASHSAIAYSGYLLGHRFVDCAMDSSAVFSFVAAFLSEQGATVPSVPGVDLSEYEKTLLDRFRNPYIKDSLLRLAQDGSNKLIITMRDAALENSVAGRSVKTFAIAVACWARFCVGSDEMGEPIDIQDPRSGELQELCQSLFGGGLGDGGLTPSALPTKKSTGLLLQRMFGEEVAGSPILIEEVFAAVSEIAHTSVRELLGTWRLASGIPDGSKARAKPGL